MSEEIRIGEKEKSAYVSACLYALDHGHSLVVVAGLGGQVSKAFDVAEKVSEICDDVEEASTERFKADNLLGVRITLKKVEKEVDA